MAFSEISTDTFDIVDDKLRESSPARRTGSRLTHPLTLAVLDGKTVVVKDVSDKMDADLNYLYEVVRRKGKQFHKRKTEVENEKVFLLWADEKE